MVTISKIQQETPHIKTFYFEFDRISRIAYPGQFLMIWIPKIDEIPLSLSESQPELAISVKNVGEATNALHSMQVGDRIGIRGPYGHGFSLKGDSLLLIGGGIGMAPFLFLLRELRKSPRKITVINGARTKTELCFLEQLQKLSKDGIECVFVTDDGTYGENGLASDIAIQKLHDGVYDHAYACGPEPMIWDIFKTTEKLKIPLQASLERLMKCGIGLCGQCCLDPVGYRVCIEGPILNSEILRKISDFGKFKRTFTGKKVEL